MQKTNSKLKDFILKILCDPVLIYTVIIMMSIMYHYKSTHTVIYGIASLVMAGLSFRIFDYMARHKFIGTFLYMVLFALFIYLAGLAIDAGSKTYPLNFGVWFLTPQDVLEYCQEYTIAIFLLFQLFMMSVIYYFTRIRYRIFMGFLIFIIPFAIYGKEFEKMPTYFIIMLAVSYIVIMINFRQLQDTEEIEIVGRKNIWKSIATYAVVFAVASAVVPKPEIEANREFLDTLISADQFTDRLTAMLGVFRDTIDNEQFRSTSNVPVYYVNSQDAMKLKLTTFSTYNFNNDSWSVEYFDKNFQTTFDSNNGTSRNALYQFDETATLTKAILNIAEENPGFAEKYNLSGLSAEQVNLPEKRWITIMSNVSGSQFAPVPELVQDFWSTSYEDEIALIRSGIIYANSERSSYFARDERFTYSYTPDIFFADSTNRKIIDTMSVEDYSSMLYDAMEYATVDDFKIIADEWEKYKSYSDYLLDYGDSQKIYGLAQEITAGFTSDYDKAQAIESYFRNNNYVYDLEYRKAKGDNAEDFIFESKRGVCYEYATAMVLLARAAGIPARYCQGYNMTHLYNNNILKTNFMVSANDAHGFPELYIRGFGWVSFEPTVSSDDIVTNKINASDALTRAGIIIFIIAVMTMIGIFIYPVVSHKLFIFRYRRKSPNEAVTAVMRRTARLIGADRGYTSQETAKFVLSEWGVDIFAVAELFDRAVYGGAVLDDKDREKIIDSYIMAYEAGKEKKRNRNRKTKKSV